MLDSSELTFLTESESIKITNWATENKHTLERGYFELRFEFSPYGDSVVLAYIRDKKTDYLEVFEGNFKLRDGLPRAVDHIAIDNAEVNLRLSESALEDYFKLARSWTEAHIDKDCEPPGFDICFKVQGKSCGVLAGGKLLELQHFP